MCVEYASNESSSRVTHGLTVTGKVKNILHLAREGVLYPAIKFSGGRVLWVEGCVYSEYVSKSG